MDESILQLTSAIAAGDEAAFTRLYRRWFDALLAEARRCTGRDESFNLDVVQDAMMKVIRSLKPLESEAALRAWLTAATRNAAIDRLRAESRRTRREQAVELSREGSSSADDCAERIAWLQGELAALDEPAARMLIMRHRFGWTLERIGRAVGLRAGAVDARLRRTLAFLERRGRERFDD